MYYFLLYSKIYIMNERVKEILIPFSSYKLNHVFYSINTFLYRSKRKYYDISYYYTDYEIHKGIHTSSVYDLMQLNDGTFYSTSHDRRFKHNKYILNEKK